MPTSVDLYYALALPPEKAIEYFKSKGYAFSWNWHDTWQEAHAKAFTVAKVMQADILQDIRSAVQKAIDEGQTLSDFQKELAPVLKAKGWWGKVEAKDLPGYDPAKHGPSDKLVQLGSPWRLRTIYQANLQTAYQAGRYKEQMESVQSRPYWQYTAVLDRVTRPSHAALNGLVFRYDDPFWQSFYPPNDWHCRCRVRNLGEQNLKDRNLSPESSAGRITTENRLVSKETGELRPVAVYKDPLTGIKVSPGVGWSYNPGRAAWQPDLNLYNYSVAKQYIQGTLSGPDFKRFLQGKIEGEFPIAVLPPEDKKLIGAESQVILLSQITLQEHLKSHKEITLEDYQRVPEILDKGEVYQQGDERLIYLKMDGVWYRLAVKVTQDKKKLYLLTLFRTTQEKLNKEVRKKFERLR